ncbi:MAG: serine hydrolase domain-containing protein [Streptosporangiaceae bacterium]
MQPNDRHLLMSVTKVFTSVVVGILERRGLLDLERPADSYIDELADSGWAGVTLNDVLGWRPAGAETNTYDLIASLPSHRRPGQVYEYTSANTFVLSWLVERVTGLPFAEVLGREIWSRGGFEASAQLCISATGAPASHGGLSITLRDLARFGMLFTSSGSAVIDAEHLRRIRAGRRPALHRSGGELPDVAKAAYGRRLPPASRQWNYVTDDGDLFKGGFGGQGLYVSPDRDVVIAFAGTPRQDGSVNQLRWLSRRLAHALG